MRKITNKKIKNFLLLDQAARRLKIFTHQFLLPNLLRFFFAVVTLLLLFFLMLKVFYPTFLNKIYNKSSFYFFHYLHLDNLEFAKINVSGNKHVKTEEIIAVIETTKKNYTQTKTGDYRPLIQNFVDAIKSQLPWIDDVIIVRNMPNILNIAVTEYEPFALWQNEGKKYITDKRGNLVPVNNFDNFDHMVILSGREANNHAESLFNIFAIDPNLSANVYSATWIGNRRWDIRFESGLLIKLPEKNISDAWQRLIEIYNMPGSILSLKAIDLRINDKTYLEYDDSVIKELKTL